jgi:uncharacterized protein
VAIVLPSFDQLMSILGYITIIVLVSVLALSLFMVALAVISMRKGHFYLPWLLRPGLIILEGVVKVLWRMGKINGNDLTSFTIRLSNQLNRERFSKTPGDRRMVFLPQCLRSVDCPASLTTEGLVCKRCMRCDIGKSIDELESHGCKVFIVPGSTFVSRLIKKYRPEAIVGVGCLMEVKEGLEMADRIDLLAMGVVTSKDGCVETILDWESLIEVIALRTPKSI